MAPLISAVTFDLWETLIHDPAGAETKRVSLRAELMSSILGAADIRVSPGDLVQAYHRALPDLEAIWADARDFDTAEQVGYVLARLPAGPLAPLDASLLAELARAYAGAAFDYPPESWPDTRSTLAEVARRGYRLGLICNTGRTPGWVLRKMLDERGILRFFDALAFSNETGIRKPNPAIFQSVLGRLEVQPNRAVHVGDDPITDVAGAKALGMRAAMLCSNSRQVPIAPDARLARLGELIPLLEAWAKLPDT